MASPRPPNALSVPPPVASSPAPVQPAARPPSIFLDPVFAGAARRTPAAAPVHAGFPAAVVDDAPVATTPATADTIALIAAGAAAAGPAPAAQPAQPPPVDERATGEEWMGEREVSVWGVVVGWRAEDCAMGGAE